MPIRGRAHRRGATGMGDRDRGLQRGRRGVRQRAHDPRPLGEQVGTGRGRATSLPSGDRMRRTPRREVTPRLHGLDDRSGLHACDVTDGFGESGPLQPPQFPRDRVRGDGDHRVPDGFPVPGTAGTHDLGNLHLFGVDVGQQDVDTAASQCQPDAGADQPGADDPHPRRWWPVSGGSRCAGCDSHRATIVPGQVLGVSAGRPRFLPRSPGPSPPPSPRWAGSPKPRPENTPRDPVRARRHVRCHSRVRRCNGVPTGQPRGRGRRPRPATGAGSGPPAASRGTPDLSGSAPAGARGGRRRPSGGAPPGCAPRAM